MSMSVTSASVPFHYLPREQRSTTFLIRSRTSDLTLGSESNLQLQFELQQEKENGSGSLTSNNAGGSANSPPLPSGPSGLSDSDWHIERSSFDLSQFDEWKKNMNQKLASAAEQHRVKR